MTRRLFSLSAPSVLACAPQHMLSTPANLAGYQISVISSGELVMIAIWLFVMFVL
jgi:hypothetical protein